MSNLEKYFDKFRKNIVGIDKSFTGPFGEKKIIYADWIASGRLYSPIEKIMSERFGPFVGNTHSESSITGTTMTNAYREAKSIIKKHVKPNGQTAGSIVEKEAPIHASNVMIIDNKTKKRTRIGHTIDKKGKKVRVAKKSNESLD